MRTLDQDFARRLEELHKRRARHAAISTTLTLLVLGFIGGVIVVDVLRELHVL